MHGLHGDDLLRVYCGFQKSLNRLNVWDVGFQGNTLSDNRNEACNVPYLSFLGKKNAEW